jgi:hypothetical protein
MRTSSRRCGGKARKPGPGSVTPRSGWNNCGIILTEDENTLTRWAARLRNSINCRDISILLKDGFRPDELKNPEQKTLGI